MTNLTPLFAHVLLPPGCARQVQLLPDEQLKNTALITSKYFQCAFNALPALEKIRAKLQEWLRRKRGEHVDLHSVHLLRQSDKTGGSTTFAPHRDNEQHEAIEHTVVVKLTPDIFLEASRMLIVGSLPWR